MVCIVIVVWMQSSTGGAMPVDLQEQVLELAMPSLPTWIMTLGWEHLWNCRQCIMKALVQAHTVDASAEADTKVILNTTGETDIYIAKYESQPFPDEPFPDEALGKWIDIHVSDPDNVTWPIYVEVGYSDAEVAAAGIDESTLGLYYYKPVDTFHRCSDTGVNMTENFIWAYVNKTEASGLTGKEFGAGGNPPPERVPALTLIGLLALIGILSVVLAVATMKKRKSK